MYAAIQSLYILKGKLHMFGNNKEVLQTRESIERIKLIRTILILMVILVAIITVLVITLKITSSVNKEEEPELSSSTINQQLAACSKLTTAELTYSGLIHFSEGDIPYINQNSFSMIYTATATAGIDISQASTTVTDTDIIITLPECELQEINVDSDSIEFYDEKTSIFNRSEKTDAITALKYAQDDVRSKADIDSLIEKATNQTETIIKGILEPMVGERNILIQYKKSSDNNET